MAWDSEACHRISNGVEKESKNYRFNKRREQDRLWASGSGKRRDVIEEVVANAKSGRLGNGAA